MDKIMLPFGMNDVESDLSEPELEAQDQSDSMAQHSDAEVNNISEVLINELKAELERFSEGNAVLKNLLISTADGFEIASLLTPGYELHIRKVSALTSSLLGISSAMLTEVGGGEQNAVFMESDQNMILFNRIPAAQKMLCLMAITSKDESIGQIFWRVRQLSENIIEICNNH
ncbi:TPA: hypothetical protein ACNVAS_002457 [Citrobacter amalonaticus]|uniref:roadblock/LC7 domain-containing protein n=2 Tax=Enterobacteriaceae TaxID=543 RepID=UPI001040B3F9|nr:MULTISPECIES: hypothetical protein [Citrobacter]EKW3840521.1 hypothetical protein [Citrobacter amalonaticus]EKW5057784.1 hypothetical protein [Citrobacter amalonaticus]ELT8120415.1 hypothetical protein [Citrobacter amalonaticus]MDV0785724.1 hypothetical protein [Citrobacter amalonaticus]MEB0641787.1 hypothetical protein [Citrobacter amalonaticus]